MSRRSLSHLSDPALRRALKTKAGTERTATADLVAYIAEYDARKLYVPDGYPSMLAYCVAELKLSEDAAGRRITAARVTRRFPVVLDALDVGRLSLTAVGLLAPHLTENNAPGLFEAAADKTKPELQHLLAERFPRSEMMAWVAEMPGSSAAHSEDQHALARVHEQEAPDGDRLQLAPERVGTEPQHALARVDRCRVKPLSAQSLEVQFTMGQGVYDKLRYAQELLSHQIPSGDIAQVFERALDALIPHLEKRKFAATSRPRSSGPRSSTNPRHIPAHVKRTVWERDGGQCTYVSDRGHRCPARSRLEFDHALEVARGGVATVSNTRLLCRSHNQFAAEQAFGAEFMREKREQARCRGAWQRVQKARAPASEFTAVATAPAGLPETDIGRAPTPAAIADAANTPVATPEPDPERDVTPWLRALGFRAQEARRAAAECDRIPEASLEERLRFALRHLAPPHRRWIPSLGTTWDPLPPSA